MILFTDCRTWDLFLNTRPHVTTRLHPTHVLNIHPQQPILSMSPQGNILRYQYKITIGPIKDSTHTHLNVSAHGQWNPIFSHIPGFILPIVGFGIHCSTCMTASSNNYGKRSTASSNTEFTVRIINHMGWMALQSHHCFSACLIPSWAPARALEKWNWAGPKLSFGPPSLIEAHVSEYDSYCR